MLEPLAVPVQRTLSTETANGRIMPADIGIIKLTVLEFRAQGVFAEPDEPSPLGNATLEEPALPWTGGGSHPQNLPAGLTGTTAGPAHAVTSEPTTTENPLHRMARAPQIECNPRPHYNRDVSPLRLLVQRRPGPLVNATRRPSDRKLAQGARWPIVTY